MTKFESETEEDTARVAQAIASGAQPGDIFCLSGPLGAGKSVFARSFIRALCGADIDVPSPTFTLVQTYAAPVADIWHFDLYRLKNAEEVYETGYEEAISDGITIIEWPERIETLIPRRARWVRFEQKSEQKRIITVDDKKTR